MDNNNKNVLQYYFKHDENIRLLYDKASRVEYDSTIWCFDSCISENQTILDVCAGPGIYTEYMLRKNNIVYASDLHPKHIFELEHKLKTYPNFGKAFLWDVSTPCPISRKFDVVLCMGALYHTQTKNWSNIIENCCSLLNEGGLFIFTYLNKAAWILKGLFKEGYDLHAIEKIENSGGGPTFYAASLNDVKHIMKQQKLKVIKRVATTGVKYLLENRINALNDSEYDSFLSYHLRHCEDEELLGYSQYCMVVASYNKEQHKELL